MFPVQTGDVTPCVLGSTPAGQVVSQGLLSLQTDSRSQAAPPRGPRSPLPVCFELTQGPLSFLGASTLSYFTKAFISTNFPHVKCTSNNPLGIPAVCITRDR